MLDSAPMDLRTRLNSVCARHAASRPELVAELIQAILDALQSNEFAGTRAFEFGFVAGQLDVTLAHTAAATDRILDVCETLDEMARDLDGLRGRRTRDASARLRDATRRIYEACGFQDITGQRIAKAVGAIKATETGIAWIIHALGSAKAGSGVARAQEPQTLESPLVAAAAMVQAEVDRLMVSVG